MTPQPTLFDPDAPPEVNSRLYTMNTKAESFNQVQKEGTAKTQREDMLKWYRRYGSLSDEEMRGLLNIPKSTISARRNEIAIVIEDKDNYHTYFMQSGNRIIKRTAKRWKIKI